MRRCATQTEKAELACENINCILKKLRFLQTMANAIIKRNFYCFNKALSTYRRGVAFAQESVSVSSPFFPRRTRLIQTCGTLPPLYRAFSLLLTCDSLRELVKKYGSADRQTEAIFFFSSGAAAQSFGGTKPNFSGWRHSLMMALTISSSSRSTFALSSYLPLCSM